ncbi:hypothetical protein L1994_03485 [Methanomicrobium antiquum]|uniref:Uncharacterized protein n=1 Tax=Methanomicrobium antiquum TaxID=487686 RepID=A0AAF0FPZ8_9EURY|nr:hypothetical protein [Methanomicrobium antiquum]WFN37462.1 hypothetical protein L1994_03485 [Methanomicrobium antiquum]
MITEVATATYLETKEFIKIAKHIQNQIESNKKQSLRIECNKGIGTISTFVKIDGKFDKWYRKITGGKIVIPSLHLYDVKTTIYSPFPDRITNNSTIHGDKCIIDLNPALEADFFSFDLSYRIDPDYSRQLVKSRSPAELIKGKVKYDLTAQLKNPKSLQMGLSEVDIENFPVTARIHINEKINSQIPEYIKRLTELEFSDDRNPHNFKIEIKNKQEIARLRKKLGNEKLEDKINNLSHLLSERNFINYINMDGEFKLNGCERGSDFFKAFGRYQLPKYMNVVSLTDLSLEKMAAKGTLIYDSKSFDRDVKNSF